MKRLIAYMPRAFLQLLGVFFDCFPLFNGSEDGLVEGLQRLGIDGSD